MHTMSVINMFLYVYSDYSNVFNYRKFYKVDFYVIYRIFEVYLEIYVINHTSLICFVFMYSDFANIFL